MVRQTLVQELDCSVARAWELFFDDDFNVMMYCEGLGFPSCQVAEKVERDGVLHRRMVMLPKVDVPKVLAKVFGDRVGFEEIGDFDRAAGVFRWRLVLAAFGDRVRIEGTTHLTELPADRCRREVAFEVEAKLFGIGGVVERTSAENVARGWTDSAKWINGWLARAG